MSNVSDREQRAMDLALANAHKAWDELRPVEKDEFRRQAEREGFRSEVSDGSSDRTNAAAYVKTAAEGTIRRLRDLIEIAANGSDDFPADRLAALDLDYTPETQDAAVERLDEWPLCIESTVTFEIVLGTGGPDTRLCFEATRVSLDEELDLPNYEIQRVFYRYSWSGSAEFELTGEDKETAEEYARRVVPELVE